MCFVRMETSSTKKILLGNWVTCCGAIGSRLTISALAMYKSRYNNVESSFNERQQKVFH